MAQIVDRRSDPGAYMHRISSGSGSGSGSGSKAATSAVGREAGGTGPSAHRARLFFPAPHTKEGWQDADNGRADSSSAATGSEADVEAGAEAVAEAVAEHTSSSDARWTALSAGTRASEDASLSRIQHFIIETLKNPVQFTQSDARVTAPVPYKPINDPKVLAELREQKSDLRQKNGHDTPNDKKKGTAQDGLAVHADISGASSSQSQSSPQQQQITVGEERSPTAKKRLDLFPYHVSLHSPKIAAERGSGLVNRGNTCYMNSTLQALLHLPPLAHALLMLEPDQLYGRFGGHPSSKFDALNEMAALSRRTVLKRSNEAPASPSAFIHNLKLYARTLVKFRQEDAHEFLRFLLDAMQYCCVAKAPKTLKPFDALRETTLIHKIFGGKLRSRVQCQRCKHNSDTFDPMLDLSLDIRRLRSDTLIAALENFTSMDILSGSEKYKCEKCNRPVEATKHFTIHEPPVVLTIHLKRFTLSGQKISKPIAFGEEVVLGKNVLSEGISPQRYRLHAVVHHHGSGPNSGHYVATVRGTTSGNRWYEMNDSSVYPSRAAPTGARDAYMLFYVRAPGTALNSVLQPSASTSSVSHRQDAPGSKSLGVAPQSANFNKKRRRLPEDDDTDDSYADDSGAPASTSSSRLVTPSQSPHKHVHTSPPSGQYGRGHVHGIGNGHGKSPSIGNSSGNLFRNFSATQSPSANRDPRGSDDDDDDLGEAIDAPLGGAYESLTGARGHSRNGHSASFANGKRPKHGGHVNASPIAARPSTPSTSPKQERGMNSLVVSPYMAGGSKHRPSGGGPGKEARRFGKMGNRMKNRFGQRI